MSKKKEKRKREVTAKSIESPKQNCCKEKNLEKVLRASREYKFEVSHYSRTTNHR